MRRLKAYGLRLECKVEEKFKEKDKLNTFCYEE